MLVVFRITKMCIELEYWKAFGPQNTHWVIKADSVSVKMLGVAGGSLQTACLQLWQFSSQFHSFV